MQLELPLQHVANDFGELGIAKIVAVLSKFDVTMINHLPVHEQRPLRAGLGYPAVYVKQLVSLICHEGKLRGCQGGPDGIERRVRLGYVLLSQDVVDDGQVDKGVCRTLTPLEGSKNVPAATVLLLLLSVDNVLN
jgi:hypothetical protein